MPDATIRRFAVSGTATKRKDDDSLEIGYALKIVLVHSVEEAEGLAMRNLRVSMPQQDGWQNHFAYAKLIEDPWTPGEDGK